MGDGHEATNCTSSVDLTRQSAMFILKTRDGRRLTQAATDNILRDVTELFQTRLEAVCHNTVETLKEAGVDDATISTVKDDVLAQCEPFKGLETEYHQNAYIRDHFGLIVRSYINQIAEYMYYNPTPSACVRVICVYVYLGVRYYASSYIAF